MKDLNDDDYKLAEGAAWIEVKGFAIRIHATDEGVVADIFSDRELRLDPFCEPLASTYAFDSDCLETEDEPQQS